MRFVGFATLPLLCFAWVGTPNRVGSSSLRWPSILARCSASTTSGLQIGGKPTGAIRIVVLGGGPDNQAGVESKLLAGFGARIALQSDTSDAACEVTYRFQPATGLFKRFGPAYDGDLCLPAWMDGSIPSEERLLADRGWGCLKMVGDKDDDDDDDDDGDAPFKASSLPAYRPCSSAALDGFAPLRVSSLGFNVTRMTLDEASGGVGDFCRRELAEFAHAQSAETTTETTTLAAAETNEGGGFQQATRLAERLTERLDLARRVLLRGGTEAPLTGRFWSHGSSCDSDDLGSDDSDGSGYGYDLDAPGVYVCAVSGLPLFDAEDKFESGSGWPSFSRPLAADHLVERNDELQGGTEVLCARTGLHLGHVFQDGPRVSGSTSRHRYCVNAAALRFVPLLQRKKRKRKEEAFRTGEERWDHRIRAPWRFGNDEAAGFGEASSSSSSDEATRKDTATPVSPPPQSPPQPFPPFSSSSSSTHKGVDGKDDDDFFFFPPACSSSGATTVAPLVAPLIARPLPEVYSAHTPTREDDGSSGSKASLDALMEELLMLEGSSCGESKTREVAYFALGCFWAPDLLFSRVPGVLDVACGFADCHLDALTADNAAFRLPVITYEEVSRSKSDSGCAEAVAVSFDPSVVAYKELAALALASLGGKITPKGYGHDDPLYLHPPPLASSSSSSSSSAELPSPFSPSSPSSSPSSSSSSSSLELFPNSRGPKGQPRGRGGGRFRAALFPVGVSQRAAAQAALDSAANALGLASAALLAVDLVVVRGVVRFEDDHLAGSSVEVPRAGFTKAEAHHQDYLAAHRRRKEGARHRNQEGEMVSAPESVGRKISLVELHAELAAGC